MKAFSSPVVHVILLLFRLCFYSGDFVEGTTNRLVTITGSPACAQTAHTLVMHKLKVAKNND